MNDLILNSLKIIKQLQNYIELNELDHKEKIKRNIFSQNIDTEVLSIEGTDKE